MSLPSGYTRLEYIESDNSAYLDTGITMEKTDSVTLEEVLSPFGTSDVRYTGANGYMQIAIAKSGYSINGTAKKALGTKDRLKCVYTPTTESLYINDTLIESNNWSSYNGATVKIGLFKMGDAGNAWYSSKAHSGKCYGASITKNGVKVREFIPCKNASGVAGMWDDVSKSFFSSASSFAFTAGSVCIGTHKTLVNGTAYEVKGGKCLVNGTAYSVKKGRTLINGTRYDITFAPSYDPVFANNTWEQIIEACHNNAVPDTWKVADHKPMTINGVDYQIDIIGKNHDDYSDGSGKAPLTFQLHDCYGEQKAMNNSGTNRGGWAPCDMRSTHLPAILALMPTEVQNGIREVNKLTSAGNKLSSINTTADKLFLLSEIEIFGSVRNSKSGEGTQYDYYKAGNSRVKNYNGNAKNWWGRSPYGNNSMYFCEVTLYGDDGFTGASYALGVPFAFCF